MQNAVVESFDARLRGECLDEPLFRGLSDARRILEAWRADHDHARPHTSLGGLTPREFPTRSVEDQTENIASL